MKKTFRGTGPLIIVLIVIFLIVAVLIDKGENSQLSYSDLISNLNNNNVESIILSSEESTAVVKIKNDKNEKLVQIPDINAFMLSIEDRIEAEEFKFSQETPSVTLKLLDYITPISIVILFILFWVFMLLPVYFILRRRIFIVYNIIKKSVYGR